MTTNQPGMSFEAKMPDMYTPTPNTDHTLVKGALEGK